MIYPRTERIILLLLLSFSLCHITSGSLMANNHKLDSLLLAYKNSTNHVNKIETALELSNQYQVKQIDKSWEYARIALNISEKNGYEPGKAKGYQRFGDLYMRKFQYDSSLYFLGRAKEIFIERYLNE